VTDKWLIALDIDGTVLREDGVMNDAVIRAVARVRDAGHEVMLATGRSVAMTLPILDRLAITPEYLVCSNGAITLKRDAAAPMGYSREHVVTFDPSEVLTTIRANLESAHYAVEDEEGLYRFTGYSILTRLASSSFHPNTASTISSPSSRRWDSTRSVTTSAGPRGSTSRQTG
jgi:hydroxymethylpyrimidine pyrophosphatase-like HAD family hydrolase